MDDRHIGHGAQRECRVQGRVAAADDHHVVRVDLVDGRQPVGEPLALEARLVGQPEAARREAAQAEGEDQGTGADLAAGAWVAFARTNTARTIAAAGVIGGADDEVATVAADVLDRLPLEQASAEKLGLVGEPQGDVARIDRGVGREVGHRLGGVEVDQLAAEGLCLEDRGREPAHAAVHGTRQSGGPTADHREVIARHRNPPGFSGWLRESQGKATLKVKRSESVPVFPVGRLASRAARDQGGSQAARTPTWWRAYRVATTSGAGGKRRSRYNDSLPAVARP